LHWRRSTRAANQLKVRAIWKNQSQSGEDQDELGDAKQYRQCSQQQDC
jgi:hypothetical protein